MRIIRFLFRLASISSALVLASAHGQEQNNSRAPSNGPSVIRFATNPILTPASSTSIGNNLNGPSLILAPSWLPNRLGRYYLYFAHHNGKYIRLAYADSLQGPWNVHEPGTLKLSETVCSGHIASPDVVVDEEKHEIRMYFHGPVGTTKRQVSLLATSSDGIHFTAIPEILGDSYFRVMRWNNTWLAMARTGVVYRSDNGRSGFREIAAPFGQDTTLPTVRHVALKLDGDILSVFYSRIGDSPERIMMSTIRLTSNPEAWKASEPVTILQPAELYEGVALEIVPSSSGAATTPLHELRDPAIYREGARTFLLYSVTGESGIAIAEMKE